MAMIFESAYFLRRLWDQRHHFIRYSAAVNLYLSTTIKQMTMAKHKMDFRNLNPLKFIKIDIDFDIISWRTCIFIAKMQWMRIVDSVLTWKWLESFYPHTFNRKMFNKLISNGFSYIWLKIRVMRENNTTKLGESYHRQNHVRVYFEKDLLYLWAA